MTCIAYIEKRFSSASLDLIEHANKIIAEYRKQGFTLTLRQLYYQFVARDLLANKQSEYKRLGSVINDARMAGRIDWESLEDRTRTVHSTPNWENPRALMSVCIEQFAIDKWARQPYAPEVWIEKDALLGVVEPICRTLDVSFFSCRGYTSQSAQWRAGQRFVKAGKADRQPIVFYLGDHDPSGLDMTRDNWSRLNLFAWSQSADHLQHYFPLDAAFRQADWREMNVHLLRLALNKDQVEHFGPPPNPAKFTDSRVEGYVNAHGHTSWELDALDPPTLTGLIETAVLDIRDEDLWDEAVAEEDAGRDELRRLAGQLEE